MDWQSVGPFVYFGGLGLILGSLFIFSLFQILKGDD